MVSSLPLSPTLSSIIKTLLKHVPSLAPFGSFSRSYCLLHISSFFLWHQCLTFAFFSFLSIGPFVSYYTNYYHSISLPFCYSTVLLGIIPFFYYNILLFYQSTILSFYYSTILKLYHCPFLSIYYSINLLFYQSTILSIYFSINLLFYQSTILSIYYSINLLYYQSTILSIYYTFILLYYHSTIPPL